MENFTDLGDVADLVVARRFAVVDVPLPPEADYRKLLEGLFADVPDADRDAVIKASELVAFGPIQIGPAILVDVARFVAKAIGRPVAKIAAIWVRTKVETSRPNAVVAVT